jgi:hypothetical protein
LESIPGLHKCLKIRAQNSYRRKEDILLYLEDLLSDLLLLGLGLLEGSHLVIVKVVAGHPQLRRVQGLHVAQLQLLPDLGQLPRPALLLTNKYEVC